MTEPTDHRELLARLADERARLDQARAQYETITRSRFHALRMLWFSLKHLIGKASPNDVYAVWSTGANVHIPPGRIRVPASGAVLAKEEQSLIESWNARISARPHQPPLVTVVIPVFNHRAVT